MCTFIYFPSWFEYLSLDRRHWGWIFAINSKWISIFLLVCGFFVWLKIGVLWVHHQLGLVLPWLCQDLGSSWERSKMAFIRKRKNTLAKHDLGPQRMEGFVLASSDGKSIHIFITKESFAFSCDWKMRFTYVKATYANAFIWNTLPCLSKNFISNKGFHS